MRQLIDRQSLLGSKWQCTCGQRHAVPVQKVLIGSGALKKLPDVINDLTKTGAVLVISDQVTNGIAGKAVADMLARGGIAVSELIIPHEKPVVDDKTADWVLSKTGSEPLFISCGSGAVTDLTKNAAYKKDRPFIAVATAPSMNGYASGIVALTERGIKKTVVSAPPVAVICDLNILCNAPIEMIRAGLGDVISKPVSMADWKLESIVKGSKFCRLPFEVIADLESIYSKDSRLLAKRDPKTIAALTEALVYSGISMVIAGSSSPASGGEHLISHTLDMQSSIRGVEHDFHGAQVGVATIVTARLYEEILALDPDSLDWTKIRKHHERDKLTQIMEYWGPLAPEVIKEFEKKRMPWSKKKEELRVIVDDWDRIVDALHPFLRPSKEIKRILTDAGAKAHYTGIGASAEDFKMALIMARTMRSRYTILDLADELDLLEEFANNWVSS